MLSKENKQLRKTEMTMIKKLHKEIQMYTKSLDDADLDVRLNAHHKILFYQNKVQECISNLCGMVDPIAVSEASLTEALLEYIRGCDDENLGNMATTAFGGEWVFDIGDDTYYCILNKDYMGDFHPKKEKL